MGLFESKPYKLSNFGGAEKAAMTSALDVGIQCAGGSSLAGDLKKAKRHVSSGALTKDDLVVTAACMQATLDALASGDDSDMRTTLLKQKAVVQVVIAATLAKLKALL